MSLVSNIDKLDDINETLQGMIALFSDVMEAKLQRNGEHTYEPQKIRLFEHILWNILEDIRKVSTELECELEKERAKLNGNFA